MKASQAYTRFRSVLRQIREEAGLSQGELARKLGKPQTFVSKSELGERRVDFLEVAAICAACRVSVNQFHQRVSKGIAGVPPVNRPKRVRPRKMALKSRVS